MCFCLSDKVLYTEKCAGIKCYQITMSTCMVVRISRIFCLDQWWFPAAWMNFLLQCKDLKCIVWGALSVRIRVKHRSTLFTPAPPPPLATVHWTKGKTGIGTGFTGLAKSLAYCVQKLLRLGFDTRLHRIELSESGVGIRKKGFPKKLRNSLGEKGYENFTTKVSMFSHEKSCQQFS